MHGGFRSGRLRRGWRRLAFRQRLGDLVERRALDRGERRALVGGRGPTERHDVLRRRHDGEQRACLGCGFRFGRRGTSGRRECGFGFRIAGGVVRLGGWLCIAPSFRFRRLLGRVLAPSFGASTSIRQRREQHGGAAGADPLQREEPKRALAARAARRDRVGFQRLRAERRQSRLRFEVAGRVEQCTLGREHRERFVARREHSRDAFLQRQRGPRRLGTDHQDAVRFTSQRHARTGAHETAADIAQPFEPRCAVLRQRCRKPRHIGRNRFLCLENPLGQRSRRRSAQHRRAGGVRPDHAGSVGGPQPCGDCTHRIGREARVARERKDRVGTVGCDHSGPHAASQRKQTLNTARPLPRPRREPRNARITLTRERPDAAAHCK